MAVHTYVGARYVPRFVGTYDVTQIYDALDVVDNGSGTSYIARKTVPAGTPLTNTDYWFVYGASSGAIISLQNDMIQAQNDIITLGSDMTNAQNDITSLQGTVASIISQITPDDMRLVVFTDSYGVTGSADGTPFIDQLDSLLGLSATDYFAFARGSVGVNPNSVQPDGVEGLVDDSYANVNDPDSITHVLFALGANDITRLSGINSAFASLITKTRTLFKNAQIYFAFIGTANTGTLADKNAAWKSYKDNARLNKCKYIGGSDLIMRIAANVKSDNVHPSSTGSNELAYYLAYGLINGNIEYHKNSTMTFSIGGQTISIRYSIDENGILTMSAPMSSAFSSPVSISGSFTAFPLTDPAIKGNGAQSLPCVMAASGTQGGCMGEGVLNSGNINIRTTGSSFSALNFSMPTCSIDIRTAN